MPSLETSLSEAILLGFCVEEYRRSTSPLFRLLESRLRPFVPLMTQTRWRRVDGEEIPSDIEWYVLAKILPTSDQQYRAESANADSPKGRLKAILAKYTPSSPPEYHFVPCDSSPIDEGSLCIGRARSCPKSVFVGNSCSDLGPPPGCPEEQLHDKRFSRVSWDTSRSSLIELVLDAVDRISPSRERMLIDRWSIPSTERWLWDFAAFLDQECRLTSAPNNVMIQENAIPWWIFDDDGDIRVCGLTDRLDHMEPSEWSTEDLCARIEKVVRADNEHADVFEAGQQFAQLVQACRDFDSYFFMLQRALEEYPQVETVDIDPDDLIAGIDRTHEELVGLLGRVATLPMVRRCHHANSIISHELATRRQSPSFAVFAVWYYADDDVGPIPYYEHKAYDEFMNELLEHLARFSGATMATWLAFGDVLSVLRETDQATAGKDRALPPLRAYQLKGDSSADKVRAALHIAEQELAEERTPDKHPEFVFVCLANGIEALARRLWANEFLANRDARRGLIMVLDEKRRSNNELEERFAMIAKSLYTTYRNAVCHDYDAFACTWAEAYFFVSGMRVLFDISEQLAQQGGS